ncbi:hypothetical protein FPV67DRAFT_417104 [Lyophyllum atratum]|nr:hypothetical protein FPV67DRAFT_417104 [Lyophyllum atratum]
MRPHGRHYKRSQGNKGQDDEHYLGAQVDDIRSETYPRLHESSRHNESYRASSSSNRSSYDAGGASTSRSQRHSDSWRHGDLEEGRHGYVANDGYHRQSGGREEHDILDTRDPEGWSSRDARYNGSRSDWSQRAASFDHWPLEDSRIDDRVMLAPDDRHLDSNWRHQAHRDKGSQKFQSDSGWDTQRRSKAWDEPPARWDVAPHEKDHRVVNERSWDPAPGWQPSGHGGHAQGNRHGQRTSASTRNSITSSNANTNHKGSKRSAYSNKPKRDWRNDDSTLNNWQKREVHASSERTTKPPPRRKHPRSSSRSRSRSPVGSYYSRRSSWDRSQSRSVSPVPKRRRRGASPPAPSSRSPSDRGRPSRAVDPHHDKVYSPYSPRSPRRSPPGYHSPRDKGRTPLPPHPRHDRDLSPLSPTSPANYASHTSGERGRAILRPNARYAKEQTPSPKRSPASYPRRQRSISSVSSVSSERSPSHSPPGRARAVHRLPSINANSSLSPTVPLRATGTTPRKSGHQRNGKGQTNGKHNN